MATVAGSKRLLDISGNNISTAVSLAASGTLLDVNGAAGTSGQVLSSTGSGVDWITNNSANYYLDGITKSGNTLTFSVLGAANQSYAFGSNAFTSTAIPTVNNATVTINTATGLDGATTFTLNQSADKTISLSLDLSDFAESGTLVATDQLITLDGNAERKSTISSIPLSIFDNNSGWTSNTGTTTPSNTQTFTNKSGNISQWTNDSGYVTSSGGSMSTWILKEGNGTETSTVSNGETVTIAQGTGIQSELTSTTSGGTLTITNTAPNIVQTTITGNAGSATKLLTARTIAGVSFDGTANISLNNNAITNGAGYITSASLPAVGDGQIDGRTSGLGLSGSMDATANQSGNTTFTVTSNAATSATASTIAYRDSAADLNVRLLRASYANQSTISGAMAFRVNNGTDNYTRYCSSPSAIRTFLGAGTGDITGVTAGTNLNGGGTSGAVTLNLDTTVNLNVLNIGQGAILQESTDRADLLQITSVTSSWAGLQIRNSSDEGRWSFMTDGSTAGFYDDQQNEWAVQMVEDNAVKLFYNGAQKFQTSSTGVTITGDLTVSGGDITLSGTGRIQGVDTVSATTDAANKAYVDNAVAAAPQGTITGSGTAGYIPKWVTTSALANSSALYNGTSGLLNINNTFSGSPAGSSSSPDLWITGSTTNSQAVVALMNAKTTSTANQVNGDIEFGTKDDGSAGYVSARIRGIQTSASGTGDAGRGELQFATNVGNTGSSPETRMVINYAGNVGIGVTGPSVKLDIAGTDSTYIAKFKHSTASGYAPGSILLEAGQSNSRGQGIYHYNNVADENWFTGVPYNVQSKKWIVANKYSTIQSTDTAQLTHALMTIDSDTGNVGIGTTSPGSKLEVNGDIDTTGSNGYLINGKGWALENSDVLTLGDWDGQEFSTRIMDNNSSEVLRVTDGRVGIGTTSPNTPLEVTGGISTTSSDFVIASTGERLLLQTAPSPYSYSKIQATSGGGTMISAALALQPDGGYVGIGTTSPGDTLEVEGGITITSLTPTKLVLNNTKNGTWTAGEALGLIDFYGNDASGGGAKIQSSIEVLAQDQYGAHFNMTFNLSNGSSGNSEKMRITGEGRVGIGTTAPLATLHVDNNQTASSSIGVLLDPADGGYSTIGMKVNIANYGEGIRFVRTGSYNGGAMKFYSNTSQVGSVQINASSTSFNTTSDYRAKENVVPMENSINRLKELKPCRFNFIIEPENTVDGFIAHEAQEVVPEAVTGEKDKLNYEGNPEYQGIDQSKIVPLLTSALQEAISKIEQLETRIQTLENN